MDQLSSLLQLEADFNKRMTAFEGELQRNIVASPSVASIAAEFASYKAFVTKALKALQQQIGVMSQTIDQLEQHSRRDILLLHGVNEAREETLPTVVVGVIRQQLQQSTFAESSIRRCQRMGRANTSKPRPILIKFHSEIDRDGVWKAKTKLKGSGYTLSEFLTRTRHQLFMKARQIFGVSSSWTHRGSVYVLDAGGTRQCIRRPEDLAMVPCPAAEDDGNVKPKPPKAVNPAAAAKTRRGLAAAASASSATRR